jgi:hypothetical protein
MSLKKGTLALAILVVVIVGCFLLVISAIPYLTLRIATHRAVLHGYELKATGWRGYRLAGIAFDQIAIKSHKNENSILLSNGHFTISFLRWLSGSMPVRFISIDTVSITVKKFQRDDQHRPADKKTQQASLSLRIFRYSEKLRKNFPQHGRLKMVLIAMPDNLSEGQVVFQDVRFHPAGGHALLYYAEKSRLYIQMHRNKKHQTVEIAVTKKDPVIIPAGFSLQAPLLHFDSMKLSFHSIRWTPGFIRGILQWQLSGLHCYHRLLSPDTVILRTLRCHTELNVQENRLEFDSLSYGLINGVRINWRGVFQQGANCSVDVQTNFSELPAAELFNAFPDGMFGTFRGMQVDGRLSYHLHVTMPCNRPEQLKFESRLTGHDFRVVRFAKVNPVRFAEPFSYTIYDENGYPIRTLLIGEENARYASLNAISPYLICCVLLAEDGSFFSHRGFDPEAFRQSIITNINEKRFARGGSTITMQLVKNLILTQDKNLSRKLEEALWVWIIENNRLLTKERMLEIYLNLIEWGPNVYGIGEAAEFYFRKTPATLNLSEAVFLAGIIPNPKRFYHAFDRHGALRNYFQQFFKTMGERLLIRQMITPEEYAQLKPHVVLSGEAVRWFTPTDTLPDFDPESEKQKH